MTAHGGTSSFGNMGLALVVDRATLREIQPSHHRRLAGIRESGQVAQFPKHGGDDLGHEFGNAAQRLSRGPVRQNGRLLRFNRRLRGERRAPTPSPA